MLFVNEVVIDASIAKNAGGLKRQKQISLNCTNLLNGILLLQITAVYTPELLAEWNKHASNYSSQWLTTMISKSRYRFLTDYKIIALRELISKLLQNDRVPLEKDVHLVEAALEKCLRIISGDEKAKRKFTKLSATFSELQKIFWVNPNPDFNGCILWLQKGMPEDNILLLKP